VAPAYKSPAQTLETPAAPAPAKKGGGGLLSALFILGVLGGLGYGGYWFVKKEAAKAEKAELNKPDLGPSRWRAAGPGPGGPVKPDAPRRRRRPTRRRSRS
jgi:hypothetical protein